MIPLVHPIFGKNEKKSLSEIIDSRIIASGKYVERFEAVSARMFGTKYAVAASNGTTALHAALLACGVKPGDKVLTTPFSFIATANSILYCGAKPVFADIDPGTYNISAREAEKVLKKEKNVKAVIIVHLYGMPCDMDAFNKLKKKYKFVLIEDCAQAHGARFKGKVVGSFGDASAFSFYATKNVTTGEGGLILTNAPEVNALARQIVNHGRDEHNNHTVLGFNFRLTNLAAGIGIEQLKHLDEWSRARRANAGFLNSRLRDIQGITTPEIPSGYTPVFHQYTIGVKNGLRDKLAEHLKLSGVGCGIYYSRAIYRQPLYAKLGYKPGLCPEAEKASSEVLSLPVHPALKKRELGTIAGSVKRFFKEHE